MPFAIRRERAEASPVKVKMDLHSGFNSLLLLMLILKEKQSVPASPLLGFLLSHTVKPLQGFGDETACDPGGSQSD